VSEATGLELVTRSREETEALGERLGRAAQAGDVIALWGELGAGKTTLVRGIAQGLGIAPRDVTSPTFVMVHEHEGGRLPLFHIDLYRVSPAETGTIGWEEALVSGGVTAIEWPDRVESLLPADRVDVRIDHAGGSERRIRIEPVGAAAERTVRGIG
jgi:tRNA threonylcarbamoyladenosine biosynthesis protein TsaE